MVLILTNWNRGTLYGYQQNETFLEEWLRGMVSEMEQATTNVIEIEYLIEFLYRQ